MYGYEPDNYYAPDSFLEMDYEDRFAVDDESDFPDFSGYWDETDFEDEEEFATESDYWDAYDEAEGVRHFERFVAVPEL